MKQIMIRITEKKNQYNAKIMCFDKTTRKVYTKQYPNYEDAFISWYQLRNNIIRDFGYSIKRHAENYVWEDGSKNSTILTKHRIVRRYLNIHDTLEDTPNDSESNPNKES